MAFQKHLWRQYGNGNGKRPASFKRRSRNKSENCGPINLTSIICKLLER